MSATKENKTLRLHTSIAILIAAVGMPLVAAEPCRTAADGELLVAAALEANIAEVRHCLEIGVPVDSQNAGGDTALRGLFLAPSRFDAARLDALTLLLRRGANPNLTVAPRPSPLTLALRRREEEAALILLNFGAATEPDADARGYVYLATHQELRRALRALLQLGRNPNAPENATERAERPIGFAVRIRDTEAVRALLSAGATVDLQGRNLNTAIHELVEPPLVPTAPVSATANIARLLAARGPNLSIRNAEGRTPIEHGIHQLAFDPGLLEPLRTTFQTLATAGATDPLLQSVLSNAGGTTCRIPISTTTACRNRGQVYAVLDVSGGRILLPGEVISLAVTAPTTLEQCATVGAGWTPIPAGAHPVQVDALGFDSATPRLACAPPPIALGSSAIPDLWPSWQCTEAPLVPLPTPLAQSSVGLAMTAFDLRDGRPDLAALRSPQRSSAQARLTREQARSRSYRFSLALPYLEKNARLVTELDRLGTTDIARSTALAQEASENLRALGVRESDTVSSICDEPLLVRSRMELSQSLEHLSALLADAQRTIADVQGHPITILTRTLTVKLDCEWNETGDDTARVDLPRGFAYCSHNITEISNSPDGNSLWYDNGFTPTGGLRVPMKCAGSYAFWDQWGSWVELSITLKGVPENLTDAARAQLGCTRPNGGSGIICVCSSSPADAVRSAYQNGGTGLSHLDVTFATCVQDAAMCRAQYARDCTATLMVIPEVPGCR